MPAGRTLIVQSTFLTAERIDIAGSVVAGVPGTLMLHASSVILRSGATVSGFDAARGIDLIASVAFAGDGGRGGGLVLVSSALTLEEGSLLVGGAGGAGGRAIGMDAVHGGTGGAGGSVRVLVDSIDGSGKIAPGRGGEGGVAIALGLDGIAGSARGGDGGASGKATVNGDIPWERLAAIPAPVTAFSSSTPIPVDEVLAILDPILKTTMPPVPIGFGVPGLPGEPGPLECGTGEVHGGDGAPGINGGDGGDACTRVIGEAGGDGGEGLV